MSSRRTLYMRYFLVRRGKSPENNYHTPACFRPETKNVHLSHILWIMTAELSYFTCVFLLTRPFNLYNDFTWSPCRWNLLKFDPLFTIYNLCHDIQKYCEISYTRSGVNQMWILKNSKELLEHLQSPNFNHITSIKSFNFSTLDTTISHQKLKIRHATIIRNSFIHKNGNRRYKFLVLGLEAPDLSRNTQIRKTSTLKMTSLTC